MRVEPARATIAIAGVTAAVSSLLLLTGTDLVASLAGGFIPARIAAAVEMPDLAWLVPAWATPLTATLIHANFIHLTLNLVMLVYCGQQTERAAGTRGLVVLYLVGAFAAAAGQWVQDPGSSVPVVGASGAISAVLGAYALYYGERRAKAWGPVPGGIVHVVWLAVAWTLIQLLVGLAGLGGTTRIAIGAHIGGFLAGLALARPLLLWRFRKA